MKMPLHDGALHGHLTPSEVLLNALPEAGRSQLLKNLIGNLRGDDVLGIQFVSSLVASKADQDVKDELLARLDNILFNGGLETVVTISSQYPALGAELFAKSVSEICQDRSSSTADLIEKDSIQPHLEFSKSVFSHRPYSDAHARLFEVCLELSTSASQNVSRAALEIVYATLAAGETNLKECIRSHRDDIWATIRNLTTSKDKQQAIRGYSLWLRYILSAPIEHWSGLINAQYWEMLLQGLRHGDSERRKLCLNIIKLSIAASPDATSKSLQAQHERYCTVFETIVLGRYINQVQECENDLKSLASSQDLDRKWLYVLLASGIDPQMQDSNRKFIGSWIMKSDLEPSEEMQKFLEQDFLPWAIQGQLFVSSLKRENGHLRCLHGNALAAFIKRMRKDNDGWLVDALFNTIRSRSNTIFAYAVVYMIEGASKHIHSKHMGDLAEVKALPEVARRYVTLKEAELGSHYSATTSQSRRETMEKAAIERVKSLEGDMATLQSVWADLEYLEFPKKLLMAVPSAFFNPRVTQQATEDQDLAQDLAGKMHTLQKVSSTKSYAFPPLVCSIRKAMLAEPATVMVLPISDFIIRTCEHPPEPTIDLLLEEVTVHLTPYKYEDFFGERRSYGFAALLDLVARLRYRQDVLQTILTHILSRWKAQKVPPPTVSAWKNTLQLQVLLICFEQYDIVNDLKVRELLDDLFHILAIEPLPRYRYLLEATIVRHVIRHDFQETIIDRINTKDHHNNPKHLASLMKVGTILACRKQSNEAFAMRLAATFVPLAASSKVVIRHEAQWRVPVLMDHCRANGWTAVVENPAYASLDSYIRSLERFNEPPLERRIGNFNPETDMTLSNVVEGQWFDLDQLEPPLTSHEDFVKLYKEDIPRGAPESCILLGPEIARTTNLERYANASKPEATIAIGPRTSTESTALQTKGTAYLARTLADPSTHASRPHELIVIGSLVDNPYNLGGLSRVSEIFGAAALTLQNQNVTSNKDFTSVSVSSHLHFPLVQLSASGVPTFLAERKREGYTVVGIEQTDRSVILGFEGCQLPKKCVLVVGSEKEGIPAVVLTECEMLVEIPQAGVTRSLNVQTAVGIVLFEYARQHQR